MRRLVQFLRHVERTKLLVHLVEPQIVLEVACDAVQASPRAIPERSSPSS